jgi:hypothetical protein
MPYHFEIIDNLPAPTILSTVTDPFDAVRDIKPSMRDLNDLLASIEGDNVYIIIDQLDMEMSFANAIQVLATVFLPNAEVPTDQLLHNRVRMIVLARSAVAKLGVKSLRQDQYGNRTLELFETREEAFDYIRQAAA